MPTSRRMVCLANSRKPGGRCIAGVELIGNKPAGWLRPVSAREHQAVSEDEMRYRDRSLPRLLDIINIPLLEARPEHYQQENWLLNPGRRWQKVDTFPWNGLRRIAKASGTLWRNGHHTHNGRNDRIPLSEANREDHSLGLIYVDHMILKVFAPNIDFGDEKRRVQARFHFSGADYKLWITDPCIERSYLMKADDEYPFGACYLTISLGEPFEGYCYKLVAAVLERPQ